ncbi:MAG: hypothetical protein ACRD20_02360 [Terriglobales bacterium]
MIGLVGEHPETRAGALRFSVFLFAQKKLVNRWLLPLHRDLPCDGFTFAVKTFDFGFNASNPSLDPFDTQFQTITCRSNILIWGVTGTSAPAVRGVAPVSPGFLFQLLHTHAGNQRQWTNKATTDIEGCGSAQNPHILKEPQLILAGDQLTISMQNLGNLELNAQVALLGGEFV